MPRVNEVRPKIWEDVIDLYDDGDYSAIWGRREGAKNRSLGVRWNGGRDYAGYPNQGKNPVWYSEPPFMNYAILCALLQEAKNMKDHPRSESFEQNILVALQEC